MRKLELGYGAGFEVRRVACPGTVGGRFSVLYLSDLHLTRWGGPLVARLIDVITKLNPDLVLLGGDYLDGRRGLPHFERLLGFLASRPRVFAVAGNHDRWFGLPEIRQLVEAHHLVWLTDKAVELELAGCRVRVSGRGAGLHRAPGADFSVVCLHEPQGLDAYAAHDLLLAGHLHGGQAVLWRSGQALYPGRWLYRWNVLQDQLGNCLAVVSKGLGDTLPVRYNCLKDVVLVTVGPGAA